MGTVNEDVYKNLKGSDKMLDIVMANQSLAMPFTSVKVGTYDMDDLKIIEGVAIDPNTPYIYVGEAAMTSFVAFALDNLFEEKDKFYRRNGLCADHLTENDGSFKMFNLTFKDGVSENITYYEDNPDGYCYLRVQAVPSSYISDTYINDMIVLGNIFTVDKYFAIDLVSE